MTIQPIGSASVALYITPADLKEHGLTPAGLTLERALAITQTAFHEAGITLEGSHRDRGLPGCLRRSGVCPCPRAGAGLVFF